MFCRLMLRAPAGLYDHARLMHPESLFDYAPRIGQQYCRMYRDGRLRCYAKSPPKVVFQTRDEAWTAAMLFFIDRGFIMDPYYCYASTHRGYRGQPKYIKGCGGWHLSRKVKMLVA